MDNASVDAQVQRAFSHRPERATPDVVQHIKKVDIQSQVLVCILPLPDIFCEQVESLNCGLMVLGWC